MSGPSPEYRAYVEAGIGIVMSVIMADGKYTEEELATFQAAQHRYDLFKDVPAEPFNDMLRRVKARLGSEGWRPLVTEWAAAVPAEGRMKMLELAVQFAAVDKVIGGAEPEVVMHLGEAMGIGADETRRVFMARIEKLQS